MRRASSISLLVAGIWLASSGGALRAAVVDWINPAGGTFSDGANWQGGKAPTAADQAVFKLTGPLTTTLNASASARRVVVTQGNTTIDLGGHELVVQSDAEFDDNLEVFTSATLTLKNGAFTNLGGLNNGSNNRGTLNVTANGLLKETNAFWSSGALNVTSGGVIEAYDIEIRAGSGSTVAIVDGAGSVLRGFYVVGDDSDLTVRNSGSIDATVLSLGRTDPTKAHANLTVTGDGSSATASLALQVGYFGSAGLTIEKQGFVHSAKTEIGSFENAIGTVTVRDPGSSWIDDGTLWIGADGQGAVAIENGATASAATAFIGDNEGSSGEVSITGSGSKWTVTNLSLKRGELSITNQGGMKTVAGNIGIDSDIHSTVVVDGTGSTWTNSSVMSVGYDGSGSLMISNGGQVVVGSVVVASQVGLLQGSTGDVVVTDAGSQWKLSSPLTIGALGNGSLKIHNGGAVSNTTASIAALEGSKGHVGVSGIGSTWTTSKNMGIGGDPNFAGGSGELEIADSGLVKITGSATVWETGSVHLDAGTLQATTINLSGGTLGGIGTVIGNLNNSGEVSPGNSPGTLKVQGNFTQSLDGLLKLEIGATAADLSQVTGNAKLGGTLHLSLLGRFTPSYGTTYDLLTASKLSGEFDTLELPDLGPGRAWQFSYGADRFTITAVPEPATITLGVIGGMVCLAVAMRRRKG